MTLKSWILFFAGGSIAGLFHGDERMKVMVVFLLSLLLAGCSLLKANEQAEQQPAAKRSPQAAHLQ